MKKLLLIVLAIVLIAGEYYWFRQSSRIDILSGKYQMFSQISAFDDQNHVAGDGSKQGYLAFGPYLPLNKGEYTIIYTLRLKDTDFKDLGKKVGVCDVNLANYPQKNVSREFTVHDFKRNNPATIALRFNVPVSMTATEFRVLLFGGNNLILEGMHLQSHSLGQALGLVKNSFLKYNFLMVIFIFIIYVAAYVYRRYRQNKISGAIIAYQEEDIVPEGIPISFLIQLAVVAFFALMSLNAKYLDALKIPILVTNQMVWLGIEVILVLFLSKVLKWPKPIIQFQLVDTVMFLSVFGVIFWLLLKPSLPSLMPINFSNDCVIHFAGTDFIYNRGFLSGSNVSSYPFGYHLVTAMLAQMSGIPPIKMLQLLLIFSIALTTAMVYALINRLFHLTKDGKLMSFLVILTLFWVRGYYELSFNQFFHAPMIFSYLFLISFLWAMFEYDHLPKPFVLLALNFAAIGLAYAYTSYLPLVLLPLVLFLLFKRKTAFKTRISEMIIAILPAAVLAIVHLKAGGTTTLGLRIMYHEGYCIPFRFWDFGDFGDHRIGGVFLVWSLIGLVVYCFSPYANAAVLFFTFIFLFYFGIFFVLKRYFNIFSYYQAYKVLYFVPYLAVLYLASVLQVIRKYFLRIVKPIIGEPVHKILAVFWLCLILWQGINVYKLENYKPVYVERITEPVYLATDWARNHIKDKLFFIYHHSNIGNWMRQGFMDERMSDQYYGEVFGPILPTLKNWLETAKSGEVAVVDDLNNPPLADALRQQLEILYQKENSAVIRKR